MSFLRVVLSRQVGKEVKLQDGNVLLVEKVLADTVDGKVNNQVVKVSQNTVVGIVEDLTMDSLLKRQIEGGFYEPTKTEYLDVKTKKALKLKATEPKKVPSKKVKEVVKKTSENNTVKKLAKLSLKKGDMLAMEKEGDLLIVEFMSYEKQNLRCKSRGGSEYVIDRSHYVSKVRMEN